MTTITETPLREGTWRVDPESSTIGFAVRHLGVATVRGRFTSFAGTIDAADDGLHVFGEVDADSVETGNGIRDARLRSEFFGAEAFPRILLHAGAAMAGGRRHVSIVTGELTIRDVTRPLALRVTVEPQGQDRLRLKAEGELSRADFGLDWEALREAGRLLVADRVKLRLDVVVDRIDH